MTQSDLLTPKQQTQLQAYKELPTKDQVVILVSISRLVGMAAGGKTPSQQTMLNLLTETGHLDIAIACYAAQLHGIDWR